MSAITSSGSYGLLCHCILPFFLSNRLAKLYEIISFKILSEVSFFHYLTTVFASVFSSDNLCILVMCHGAPDYSRLR